MKRHILPIALGLLTALLFLLGALGALSANVMRYLLHQAGALCASCRPSPRGCLP